MFSGEALDLTAPYITRQMAYYIEGYAVLGQVYNAYEEVYGAGSLTETRTVMRSNLTGSASPFRLSSEYFSQYRLTFVNKSNSTKIKLSRRLHLESNLGESLKTEYNDIPKSSPAYMTKNPLSASQVKALAAYCKERKMTLFEFLMNKMKFKPYIEFSDMVSYCPFCYDLTRPGTIKPEGDGINKNKIYLATGAQSYKRSEGTIRFVGTCVGGYMQAVKMTEVGASDSQIQFFRNDTPYHVTMMFFTKY